MFATATTLIPYPMVAFKSLSMISYVSSSEPTTNRPENHTNMSFSVPIMTGVGKCWMASWSWLISNLVRSTGGMGLSLPLSISIMSVLWLILVLTLLSGGVRLFLAYMVRAIGAGWATEEEGEGRVSMSKLAALNSYMKGGIINSCTVDYWMRYIWKLR